LVYLWVSEAVGVRAPVGGMLCVAYSPALALALRTMRSFLSFRSWSESSVAKREHCGHLNTKSRSRSQQISDKQQKARFPLGDP